MSRLIDRLPTPEKVKEKKLIVLSRSRVGTFSLYESLKILGYTPFHMFEIVTSGATQMELLAEALRCKYQGKGKRYGKAEFDKWWANYDAIVEIPQFFIEECVEFYPDAKFIIVERDINAWERSLNNTVLPVFDGCRSFPMNISQYFDNFVKAFVASHIEFEDAMFHNKGIRAGMEDAKRDMISDVEKAKKLVPRGQLLHCSLETGFGWEEICPFLEIDIPETPYPRGNAPAQFEDIQKAHVAPHVKASIYKLLGTVLVPVISIGTWSYMKAR